MTRPMIARAVADASVIERHEEWSGDALMGRHGFAVVRFSQARASKQTPGIPDRRYYCPSLGVAVWWDAKRPVGGRQSKPQREFQALCEACGETYLVGPVDVLVRYLSDPRSPFGVARSRQPVTPPTDSGAPR